MPDAVHALLAPYPAWLVVLPAVVPLLVAVLKVLDHLLAGWVYPLAAVLVAVCIVGGTAVVLDLPRTRALGLGAVLGLAGIGVREVVDQLWQAALYVRPRNGNGPLQGLPR